MLILTRRRNEVIRINDNIRIIIGKIHEGSVRIVVDAPPEISVNREEVHLRMQAELGAAQ